MWRIERARRGGRTHRVLRTGSGEDRRSISLGCVDREIARHCLDSLTEITHAGELESWMRWHERAPKAAIAALRGTDPVGDTERLSRDPGGWTLTRYFREVYAPWRRTAVRSWTQERSHWVRILREIGHVRVRDVDPLLVADMLDRQFVERAGRRKGAPLSGNSKRLLRASVQALLERAYRLRHIDQAPRLADIRLKGSTRRLSKPQPLSVDEVRRLLSAATTPTHRAMWAVQIGIGLRPSETIRMRWEDIEWGPPTVLDVRGTKTEDAAARVPVTPLAGRWLRVLWKHRGKPDEGLVFVGQRGRAYKQAAKGALSKAAERAGIEGRPVTPYLLRHTFATLARDMGLDRDTARRILRHTSDRMLAEIYDNPSPDQLARRSRGFDLGVDIDPDEP